MSKEKLTTKDLLIEFAMKSFNQTEGIADCMAMEFMFERRQKHTQQPKGNDLECEHPKGFVSNGGNGFSHCAKCAEYFKPEKGSDVEGVDNQRNLDNWIGWLQRRIPNIENGSFVFWLKLAMNSYKNAYCEPMKTNTAELERLKKVNEALIEALECIAARTSLTGEDAVDMKETAEQALRIINLIFKYEKRQINRH